MNEKIANDLIRYADLVEDAALISPEEMNCASLMRLAAETLAQPEQERCVGCEACIDTACGRDECPKGWPKAAQPEQEPVAWITQGGKGWLRWHKSYDDNKDSVPLYTTPPQRKPLTDEEIGAILEGVNAYGTRLYTFARAIEAAHGIKE